MPWNEGIKTFYAGEDLAANRRVKIESGTTSDPPEVKYADAGEDFVGVTLYAADEDELVSIKLNSSPGTFECECSVSSSIGRGTILYGAADGKVSDASSGTAQGISLEAATDGAVIEVAFWNVKATTAATVSVLDTASHFSVKTAEAALAQLAVGLKTAQYTIQPSALMLESGAAIGAFANGTTDGWTQLSSKAMAIRWNDGGTPTDIVAQFILPQDYDDAAAVVVHFLGAIVKAGGSESDSPTLTCEAYFDVAAAAPAADTDCGGTSGEFLTASGAVLQEKMLTISADDAPAAPTVLTLIFHPTDGQLATDDFVCLPPWLEVTRKILAA
jgi:hypothetical protein